MPQAILPLFSKNLTMINLLVSVQQNDHTVYWFLGNRPVFSHHVSDHASFRMQCCQMINNGNAKAIEIARSLNINEEKLSRWVRQARKSYEDAEYKKN